MITHPNALLLHQCLQAANAGDRQTLRALWADDIVWQVKGTSPWQGELKGADEIFEYLASLGEVGEVGIHTEIDDVLVSEQRAAVLCRSKGEVDDRSLDARFLMVASIVDRRVQHVMTVQIDADRFAEFWNV